MKTIDKLQSLYIDDYGTDHIEDKITNVHRGIRMFGEKIDELIQVVNELVTQLKK